MEFRIQALNIKYKQNAIIFASFQCVTDHKFYSSHVYECCRPAFAPKIRIYLQSPHYRTNNYHSKCARWVPLQTELNSYKPVAAGSRVPILLPHTLLPISFCLTSLYGPATESLRVVCVFTAPGTCEEFFLLAIIFWLLMSENEKAFVGNWV